MSEDFPSRDVLSTVSFGANRCGGTFDLEFDLNVPDDWIVPDAGNSPYGGTPNSSFALITTDGQRAIQGQVLARCTVGGPVHLPDWMRFSENRLETSLRGEGLYVGTAGHGASGLSTLGGTIRLGELTGEEPIRHVLKINPFAARFLHYSRQVPGHIWPARRADGYAGDANSSIAYNPDADPRIVMGTLLAIPPGITADSLGLTTEPGRKLFAALQDYGTYFVEDAAYDTWDIVVERDVELEFDDTYGFSMGSQRWLLEMNKLMGALHIVTNNTALSVGGGGEPRVPPAPDFAPLPLPTFNVFRLHPRSDPEKSVTALDGGPEGSFLGYSNNLVQLETDTANANQLWLLEKVGGNYVQISSVGITRDPLCMDIDNAGFDGATNVRTGRCNTIGKDNQQFILTQVPNRLNHYYIRPRHATARNYVSDLHLSVEGDLTADSANIASLPADGTDAQIFVLEAIGDQDVLFAITSTNEGATGSVTPVSIYPNPNQGAFYFSTPLDAPYTIYDVTGKVVYRGTSRSGVVNSVDIREKLSPGNYALFVAGASPAWFQVVR